MNILLLILFVIHEIEEIYFLPKWLKDNREDLKIDKGKLINRKQFSIIVIEEFIILVYISFFCYNKQIWGGVLIAYTLHLFIHLIQSIVFMKNKLFIFSSYIEIPICIYLIFNYFKGKNLNEYIAISIIAIFMMFINLIFMHKLAKRFIK